MVSQTITTKKMPTQGIKVTDFGSGESVRTDTTNGKVVSRRYSGGGGSSRARDLEAATAANEARVAQEKAAAEKKAQEQARQQAEQQRLVLLEAKRQQQLKQQQVTSQEYGNVQQQYTVRTEPYVEQRQTGTYTDPNTGKVIPTTTTYYVDPRGESRGGGAYVSTERIATKEEADLINKDKELVADNPGKVEKFVKPVTSKATGVYENINQGIKDVYVKPVSEYIVESTKGTVVGGDTGLTLEKAKQNIKESSEYLKDLGVPKGIANTGEFLSGVGVGVVEDVKDKPLKNIAIVGAGVGVGAGLKIAGLGASSLGVKVATKFPKVGAAIPNVVDAGINIAGVGVGTVYAADTLPKIFNASSPYEAGAETGIALKDLALFGTGARVGTKIAEKGYDVLATKGRVELPIEDYGLVPIKEVLSGQKKFVESSQFGGSNKAGPSKQSFDLKVFQKAGRAYSATPNKFWDKQFTAAAGSSEFKGLYGAPSPSVYFLKAGGESGTGFGLFKSGGKPALATIEGGPKIFTAKDMKIGKGYVTGIKPEIEAVFAEGTQFVKVGSETYFKYQGRRIPVDRFEIINTPTNNKIATVKDIKGSYSSDLGSSASVTPVSLSLPSGSSSSGSSSNIKSIKVPSIIDNSISSSGSSASGSSPKVFSSGGSSRGSSKSSYTPSSILSSPSSGSSGSRASSSPSSILSSKRSYLSSRGSSGSSSSLYESSSIAKSKQSTPFKFKLPKANARPSQRIFGVEVRRGGKFKNVGFGSLKRVQAIGQKVTGTTLAASYRITGSNIPGIKIPKNYYSKIEKGKGLVVIEKIGQRLKRGTREIPEILEAKKRKTKRKKK